MRFKVKSSMIQKAAVVAVLALCVSAFADTWNTGATRVIYPTNPNTKFGVGITAIPTGKWMVELKTNGVTGSDTCWKALKLSLPSATTSNVTLNGTAKPSTFFVLSNDTGSGFIFSTGPLTSTTGIGAERMRIQASNGYVGIGTTAPSRQLVLSNSDANTTAWGNVSNGLVLNNPLVDVFNHESEILFATTTNANVFFAGIAGSYDAYTNQVGGSLNFGTRSGIISHGTTILERMRITSEGNVCIGTTYPGDKLIVADNGPGTNIGGITISNLAGKVLNSGSTLNFSYDNAGHTVAAIAATLTDASGVNGDLQFKSVYNGAYNNTMMIKSSGNIGIGITPTSAKLEVNGQIKVYDNINLNGHYLSGDGSNSGISFDPWGGVTTVGDLSVGRNFYAETGIMTGGGITVYNGAYIEGGAGIYGNVSIYSGDLTLTDGRLNIKGWYIKAPDYVFNNDYKLRDLGEVEKFIKNNKHLPDVPSAKEMKSKGVDLVEMNMKLLQKVEELTLYTLEERKILKNQGKVIAKQQKEIEALKRMAGR